MAPLTKERTMGKYAFEFTGCDLAGPFFCSAGARRSPHKRWIIIWTCLTTRAVRLDYVTDLSEKAFLRAYTRFINRNNEPKQITSDNGTNFVSASKTLRKENPKLEWKFISPSSPWMGGVWEVMVRETKKALIKTLEFYSLDDEGLVTCLSIVENSLNARPLTYLSDNPKDLQIITPQSFLAEKVSINPLVESESANRLGNRWRLIQEILRQAWERFLKEFIPKLNYIPKWTKTRRPILEGDLVLVMKHDTPRHTWPYGIVKQTLRRDSDDTRIVLVKLANGQILTRPAAKLIPIDVSANNYEKV
jgi:transposase InsO family protein